MLKDENNLYTKIQSKRKKSFKSTLVTNKVILILFLILSLLLIIYFFNSKKVNIYIGNSQSLHEYALGTKKVYTDNDDIPRFIGTHICLLLDDDIFEYGIEDKKGIKTYLRKQNVGKQKEYNWTELSVFKGTTNISANDLDYYIINDKNNWNGNYDINNHNCQDFIYFCLQKIGCKKDIRTYFPSRSDWDTYR